MAVLMQVVRSTLSEFDEVTLRMKAVTAHVEQDHRRLHDQSRFRQMRARPPRVLLSSLKDSFQFLTTALESHSDELTWELVTSRLLHEDLKRKEQHDGVSASDKAFYTNWKRTKN